MKRQSELGRFLAKVRIDDNGCWRWIGTRTPAGYGVFWRNKRQSLAHRASYEMLVGSIGEGLMMCHTCDVRECVNPDHLYPGTAADNGKDKADRGRAPSGRNHHAYKARKLREDQEWSAYIAKLKSLHNS